MASATRSPIPKQITPAELAKLRWIEGGWRGTGGGVPPFFERYKFENESTLVVETLEDETLSKVTDVSRFELKDGHFGSGTADSGSVAIALDDNSISFAPLGKGKLFPLSTRIGQFLESHSQLDRQEWRPERARLPRWSVCPVTSSKPLTCEYCRADG